MTTSSAVQGDLTPVEGGGGADDVGGGAMGGAEGRAEAGPDPAAAVFSGVVPPLSLEPEKGKGKGTAGAAEEGVGPPAESNGCGAAAVEEEEDAAPDLDGGAEPPSDDGAVDGTVVDAPLPEPEPSTVDASPTSGDSHDVDPPTSYPSGGGTAAAPGTELSIDGNIDQPSPLRSAVPADLSIRPGFQPRSADENSSMPPGAVSVVPGRRPSPSHRFAGSEAEGQLRRDSLNNASTSVDVDGDAEVGARFGTAGSASRMDVTATATLVEAGVVVDATAVDLEAEAAERERLRAENEELQQRLEEAKSTKCLWSNRRRRNWAIAAACLVAVVALAAGLGAGLGGKAEAGSGSNASEVPGPNGAGKGPGAGDAAPGTGEGAEAEDAAATEAAQRLDAVKAIVAPLSREDAFLDDGGAASAARLAALDWVARLDLAQVPTDGNENARILRQRYVLAVLYYSTGGEGWTETFGFLSEEDVCDWFELEDGIHDGYDPEGVICDERGLVKRISLYWNNLIGTLPPELSYFSDSLDELNFTGGSITSTIPSEFGDLTKLTRLYLSENCLSGSVPESLFALQNLEMIMLNGNSDLAGSLNGFCNGAEYKGNLTFMMASCESCPWSPALVQCDCCVCCDIVTYNCCDKDGSRLWNHANIGLNAAGQPYSFDKPCLSEEALAYYLENQDDLSWITEGRGDGW